MIVTDHGDHWRLVTQPDHARFSAELLHLWRGPELAAHPRRGEILFAVREHDNGWREADAAPRWNPAPEGGGPGRPHDFLSVGGELRLEIWRRGTRRFAEDHPYATALIVLHALTFGGGGAWDDFAAELEERRDELLEVAGVGLDEARTDYRWLHWADTASLAACAGWTEAFERRVPGPDRAPGAAVPETALRPVRGRFDPATRELLLDPLPLAGATRIRIPCRRLGKGDFAGDADFATALATARWEELEVRVRG